MSAAAIKAGQAWVELGISDKTQAGLDRAKQRFADWGAQLSRIGTLVVAASTGVLAGLVGAASHLATAGSQLNDFAQRTGLTTDQLQGLAFAAKMSGAQLQDLMSAMRALAKFTAQVAAGNKLAIKTLELLGIRASDFLAQTPYAKLLLLSDGLARIEDPTLRAALAMKALGGSGAALVPMLKNGSEELQKLVARAQELGMVLTPQEIAQAQALGDSWNYLGEIFKTVTSVIGSAIASELTQLVGWAVEAGAAVVHFIRMNLWLVKTLVVVAGAGVALGFVLLTVANAIRFVGMTIGAVNAIITFAKFLWTALGVVQSIVAGINAFLATQITAEGIAASLAAIQNFLLAASLGSVAGMGTAAAAVMAALTSPLAILVLGVAAVTTALAGGMVWFFAFTAAGQQFARELGAALWELGGIALTTFQGIWDALMAGNWEIAGLVAFGGLKAAFQTSLQFLERLWLDFELWFMTAIADLGMAVYGGIVSAVQAALGVVNQARAALGLEPLKNDLLRELQTLIVNTGEGVKKSAQKKYNAAIADRQEKVDEANRQLDAIVATAKAEKERAMKNRFRVPGLKLPNLGDLTTSELGGGSAAGAFNAAVKGMLGRSGESVQERIAANTDSMNRWLEEISKSIEEMGVEFGP